MQIVIGVVRARLIKELQRVAEPDFDLDTIRIGSPVPGSGCPSADSALFCHE
jgi:hypothetical protein